MRVRDVLSMPTETAEPSIGERGINQVLQAFVRQHGCIDDFVDYGDDFDLRSAAAIESARHIAIEVKSKHQPGSDSPIGQPKRFAIGAITVAGKPAALFREEDVGHEDCDKIVFHMVDRAAAEEIFAWARSRSMERLNAATPDLDDDIGKFVEFDGANLVLDPKTGVREVEYARVLSLWADRMGRSLRLVHRSDGLMTVTFWKGDDVDRQEFPENESAAALDAFLAHVPDVLVPSPHRRENLFGGPFEGHGLRCNDVGSSVWTYLPDEDKEAMKETVTLEEGQERFLTVARDMMAYYLNATQTAPAP